MLRVAPDPSKSGGRFDGAPLIGVTTSEIREVKSMDPIPRSEPPRPEMALGLSYLKAIEGAGGLPVVLPPLPPDAIGPMLDGLDGICLSGGPDLDPAEYGQDPHESLGPTWRDLDIAELAVAREADSRGMPILAICRGAQALNVARRGTLFQHLADRYGEEVTHRQKEIGSKPVHPVQIEPDSRLAKALGVTSIEVNSFHHQSADQLGRGLRAVGFSPDGVIEAIEATGSRFVVGVQWHAESLTDMPEQASLFRAFVEAARAAPARERRQAA
jgi:putative glutamine amidotransferase